MADNAAALNAVINPLLDAICPRKIDEPKEKISILLREVLKEQLGDKGYANIVDRFIIHGAEADPDATLNKLVMLRIKLTEIIDEIAREGEE